MSMHDRGYGRKAGPTPEVQSDFADGQSAGHTPSAQSWSTNALNPAQTSEVPFMVQGAGRPPGQPIIGQRSIFGGGSPVFAQMPTYTPVTRADQRPQAPEPQSTYTPTYTPPAPPSRPSPQQAAPSRPAPQPAAPNYANFPGLAAAPSYQLPEQQPQAYHGAGQPARAPNYPSAEQAAPQPYPAPGYNSTQGFPGQAYQPQQPYSEQNYSDSNFADATFPETVFPDTTFSDPGYAEAKDASFGEASFGEQNFANPSYGTQSFSDASFPEQGFDASFPDSNFSAGPSYGQGDAAPAGTGPHGYETFQEEPAQDYQSGAPQSDPRRQLQAFDALYDQPPQIALGSTEQTRRATQDFYEGERVDADFLDESQVAPPPNARAKMAKTLRGRSAFMVGSALLGAIALGGALAFAYKQSGGGLGSEQPPLVTADNRPVKEVPDQPGGKEFPHKNKLIYDRLTNGDEPESERLVPRQEDVAVPALPPSTETAGLPTPVATTDLVTPQTTEAIDTASAEESAGPDGGPRRVKTLKVLPDGSVEAPPPEAPAAADASAPTAVADAAPDAGAPAEVPAPAPALPEPAPAAAAAAAAPEPPAPAPAPAPAPKPAPQQVAAVQPAPKAAAPKPAAQASTKYVVQVGSKKNQTDALATFADMQQKYPSLLSNYRPMVQKADLGSKGTWYRLRIGPISDKGEASSLCSKLKSQGQDCLVMAQ